MVTNLERSLIEVHALVAEPQRGQSDEVTRALSRFLVVRTCGFLEQVTAECLIGYIKSKSELRVASYGCSWLGRGSNPSPGNLVDLVSRFDGQWSEELTALFDADDQRLRRGVASLVGTRNKIAHGLGENVNARKALDFVELTTEVSDWFIRRFDPR